MTDLKEKLRNAGYVEVETEEELTGKTYTTDRHCYDVIFFPCDQRDFLENCSLVKDGYVVAQVNHHNYTTNTVCTSCHNPQPWKY